MLKKKFYYSVFEDFTGVLTFTCEQSGGISMTHYGSNTGSTKPSIQYNKNNGSWSEWDGTNIPLNVGDVVKMKGINASGISRGESSYSQFIMTGKIAASGNIMSLIDGQVNGTKVIPGNGFCFFCLFQGCTSLTSAPMLPATTLTQYCYLYMFNACGSLTTAPSLPATALTEGCYYGMFLSCNSLSTSPELPATTIAPSCYYDMFRDCTTLVSSPSTLPSTSLTLSCYFNMFNGCHSLTNAPKLPATTLANYCYYGMFQSCRSLTTAPSLPATALTSSCYSNMFNGCTSLTDAPLLPAVALVSNCYYRMFYNCTVLNYIEALFTTIPSTTYTNNWVYGVASSGTFIKNKNATWSVTGVNGVPTNWVAKNEKYLTFSIVSGSGGISLTNYNSNTPNIQYSKNNGEWTTWNYTNIPLSGGDVIRFRGKNTSGFSRYLSSTHRYSTFVMNGTISSIGSATSLMDGKLAGTSVSTMPSSSTFYSLFKDCTALRSAPELPATTLSQYCYRQMFQGCTNLSVLPTLPSTSMTNYCYYAMFSGCTSLTEMPSLPATKLATYCYGHMFNGCRSLITISTLPATSLSSYCYYSMFKGCSAMTTAPGLSATTLTSYCYGAMFSGCTSLNYIYALFTTTPSTTYTNSWVAGVASSGTFIKKSSATWNVRGVNGVPTNWTIQTAT